MLPIKMDLGGRRPREAAVNEAQPLESNRYLTRRCGICLTVLAVTCCFAYFQVVSLPRLLASLTIKHDNTASLDAHLAPYLVGKPRSLRLIEKLELH